MDQAALTPSEIVARCPAVARPFVTPLDAAARWVGRLRYLPAGASIMVLLSTLVTPEIWGDRVDTVFPVSGLLFVLGLGLLGRRRPLQATSPEVVRLFTALLALEAAGAITLRREEDGTLVADPGEDGPVPFPAWSLEASLVRGRTLPLAEIVGAWLGDRSSDANRRAGAVMALLAVQRAAAMGAHAPVTPARVTSADEARVAQLLAGAAERHLLRPVVAAVKDGLGGATVQAGHRGEGDGGGPVYYDEDDCAALLPHNPPAAVAPAEARLPIGNRVIDAVSALAGTALARSGLKRTPLNPWESGCLLQLFVLIVAVAVAIPAKGVLRSFTAGAPWWAGVMALIALVAGALGRRRRKRWQGLGYLAFEDPPEPTLFGSWAVGSPNGGNRSSPIQDLLVGGGIGLTFAFAYSYVSGWLVPVGFVFLYLTLRQPWRAAALSPLARQRIVSANLGQPVETTAGGAPVLPVAPASAATPVTAAPSDEPPVPPGGALTLHYPQELARAVGSADPLGALQPSAPHHLLLLRVFGSAAYGEIVGWLGDWTRVGNVIALEGPDTVAGNAALDRALVTGRIEAFLIDTPEEADSTIEGWLAAARSPYRHLTAQCTNATWRQMVTLLMARSDLVLMDLSGFCAARQGSTWELLMLANHLPVERITLLVNTDTDLDFLAGLLSGIRDQLDPTSPNHGRDVDWRVLMIGGRANRGPDESHWDWLRRLDCRISPAVLCACLGKALVDAGESLDGTAG